MQRSSRSPSRTTWPPGEKESHPALCPVPLRGRPKPVNPATTKEIEDLMKKLDGEESDRLRETQEAGHKPDKSDTSHNPPRPWRLRVLVGNLLGTRTLTERTSALMKRTLTPAEPAKNLDRPRGTPSRRTALRPQLTENSPRAWEGPAKMPPVSLHPRQRRRNRRSRAWWPRRN